ncbi:MAG: uracil-DNA glycosylase [Planctomycetota bacterium]
MSERGRLAAALRAHVGRRRAMGERRTGVGGAVVTPKAPRAPHHPEPPPSRGEREEDRAAPAAVAASPAESAPKAASAAVDPAPTPGAPTAPAEPAPALPANLAPACSDLDELRQAVAGCTACRLCESRTQTVFADGTGSARILFVGEAPGFHEDRQGVPFVGNAGQLLTDIITKGMGLAREDVYIANVLKCRPPENRDPTPEEKALCTPWLDRQIELLQPAVLVPLGRHAANHVLRMQTSMGRLRGRVYDHDGRKVVPTYHPSYLLRNPADKKECWKDIQLAMAELGLQPPARG